MNSHQVLQILEEVQSTPNKLKRYRVLSQGKVNWAVYNRVKKLFNAAQELWTQSDRLTTAPQPLLRIPIH